MRTLSQVEASSQPRKKTYSSVRYLGRQKIANTNRVRYNMADFEIRGYE